MDYKTMLRALPRSYDDFVNDTADWMERDNSIRDAVLDQLHNYPVSTPSDVLKIVCEKLGMMEPLEIVDDDDEESVRKSFKVAML